MENTPLRKRAQPISLFIAIAASGSLLFILAVIVFYIAGFYENDPELPALIPAIILCFSVGLIFLTPAFFTLKLALKNLRGHSTRGGAILASLFNLPIVFLSGFILKTQSLPWTYAVVLGTLAAFFLIYGGLIAQQITKSQIASPN